MQATRDAVDKIRSSITEKPPLISGLCKVAPNDLKVVFNIVNNNARCIDLATASPELLEELSSACQPATFGRNNEDVYDETYRKAGKMDASDFISSLDPFTCRIVDIIKEKLLDQNQSISAEMYKLNVYGKDSFFKAHKDTPREENMIGSLVVVFPTPHEGGALVLRHGTKEWTFDSGIMLQGAQHPSVAYVAFFSDVEHEVTMVTSGHRVTLTWNLYLVNQQIPTPAKDLFSPENELSKSIKLALNDPSFLSEGGTLGFGLNFQYPVSVSTGKQNMFTFDSMTSGLKGSDALLFRALSSAGLEPLLRGLYMVALPWEDNGNEDKDGGRGEGDEPDRYTICDQYGDEVLAVPMLIDHVPTIDESNETSAYEQLSESDVGAKVVYDYGCKRPRRVPAEITRKVLWVTEPSPPNLGFYTPYLAYGNESSMEYMYANLVLVATVLPAADRVMDSNLWVESNIQS